MTAHYRRPSEVFSSQRRTSATIANGVDHSSCYRVEEDILSRVRSLLHSRNHLYPPRTPYTSDEDRHRYSADCDTSDTGDRFDFSVAKSIAELTYRRTHSDMSNMDVARRPTLPSIPIKKRTLRTTSSTNDLGASLDDATVHATLLTCCPPCLPEEPKKIFRLPRLVLKDKSEKKRDVEFRSCIDFTPRMPPNGGSTQNTDPPGDLPRKTRAKSIEEMVVFSGKVKAEPADITCFLAGCGPGECNRHSRRSSQQAFSPKQKDRSRSGTNSVSKDMAEAAYELGLIVDDKGLHSASMVPRVAGQSQISEISKLKPTEKQSHLGKVHASTSRPTNIRAEIKVSAFGSDSMPSIGAQLTSRMRPAVTKKEQQGPGTAGVSLRPDSQLSSSSRQDDFEIDSRVPGRTNNSPSLKSPTSSVFSQDVFPHVLKSQELAAKATLAQSFSGTIVTNFSLPGPKPKKPHPSDSLHPKEYDVSLPQVGELALPNTTDALFARATDIVRPKQSEASLKSKLYSPSLLSGASKASSVRHALLKPSVSAAEPIDAGLPIPPVLTHLVASCSETTSMDVRGPEKAGAGQVALVVLETPMMGGANSQKVEKSLALNADETPTAAVTGHLTTLQNAMDLADRIKERVSKTEELKPIKSLDNPIKPISNSTLTAEASFSPVSKPVDDAELSTNPLSKSIASLRNVLGPAKHAEAASEYFSETDHVNATYWGFVPSVKEAVQDAVQVAVRKAVNEIAVPSGVEHNEASRAYRKLVGDSLSEAAQTADEYLRRASLWNEPLCSERGSEGTADFQDGKLRDQEPSMTGVFPKESPPVVVNTEGPVRSADQNQRQQSLGNVNVVSSPRNLNQSRGNIVSNAATSQVGSTTSSYESHQNFMRRMKNPSRDNLDTIPLQNMDKIIAENLGGWKGSGTWKGRVQKCSPGHTAIPTRHSSKNHLLGSKNQTTAKLDVKESLKGSRSNKISLEPLRSTTSRVLQTVSSLGSLPSCASDVRDQQDGKKSVVKGLPEANTNKSSVVKISSVEKLVRKNTVHWLRDLLSTNGPYETRFTALPPRQRRDQNSSTGRIESRNASAKHVTELSLGAIPESDQLKSGIPKIENSDRLVGEENLSSSRPETGDLTTAAITETFAKTINDLEFLLNEALFIARQAADKEDGYAAGLLGSAAAVLTGGRKGAEHEIARRRVEEGRGWSLRYGQKHSENVSSFASIHESLGSYSGSNSSFGSEEEAEEPEYDDSPPKLRLITPTIGMVDAPELTHTIQHAGWARGRIPTPYPSGSVAPSPVESGLIRSNCELPDNEITSDSFGNTNFASSYLKPLKKDSEAQGLPVSISLDRTDVLGEDEDPIPVLENGFVQDVNPFLGGRVRTELKSAIPSEGISPTKRSRASTGRRSRQTASRFADDSTLILDDPKPLPRLPPMPPITPRGASIAKTGEQPYVETGPLLMRNIFPTDSVPSKREVREYIIAFHHPPIQPRASSLHLRTETEKEQGQSKDALSNPTINNCSWQNIDPNHNEPLSQTDLPHPPLAENVVKPAIEKDWAPSYTQSYDGSHPSDAVHFDTGFGHRQHGVDGGEQDLRQDAVELRDNPDANLPQVSHRGGNGKPSHHLFNLEGRNHVSLRGEHHKGFSFARTHKKPKIARDWAPARKRFVATVACISTALVGLLVGIYAAEVPAIQYWIVDLHHYTILGNVFFFIGLSIPTFFFWPLPLLHGRKPYTLGSMALAMPLLFPQALAVGQFRSPNIDYWRVGLILPRALMGFVLGFANMNFKGTLTDLFGASLQNNNPHQEVVDEDDVRRHGGGLGVWLGIWTWCSIGSIGMGFLFGAIIINHAQPAWGFYVSIAIIAGVLFLNVLCPEVRRSAFRRSVAEVKNGTEVSRRVARGEVKMHMVQTGPLWWGEEFHYGVMLNAKMLRQPGFMVMAVYVAWIYGQIVLLIVLLGSLTSKYYKFKSPYVGASVMAVPIGAFLAIPFQKASLFSRSRANAELEDDNANTLKKKVTLSSHLVRRAIFILVLPFAGLGYTLTSNGPPIPFILPILFAGLIGFLSNLAMGECHGIIMETFDTSDLQPGMTGRPRGSSGDRTASKRTNYSSFPRVSSGFAITQGIGYLLAAIATGVGGVVERNIGQQAATGVMAGILLILSLLLLGVLARFRNVQIIPTSKEAEMERWKNARRVSAIRKEEGLIDPEEWRPVIIGNPTHIMRRMCILEMGGMTRWSEIRRKNHLVDQNALESKHPNLAVIRDLEDRIKETEEEILHHVRHSISRHSLSRNSSRRSRRSDRDDAQPGDLGGHREMLNPSGKGSRKRHRAKSRIPE